MLLLETQRHRLNETNSIKPRDWRPKWSALPSDQLDSHFTDYELSSMKAMTALNASAPFTEKQKTEILREHPCDVNYGLTSCCLGTYNSAGNGNEYRPGTDSCYKRRYDIRMDMFQQHAPSTSHDLFWNLTNNSNIFIIGDSVNHQIFDGFVCDVIRQNQNSFNLDDKPKIDYQQSQGRDVMMTGAVSRMSQWVPNWKELSDPARNWRYGAPSHEVSLKSTKNGQVQVVNVILIRSYRPLLELYKDTFCEWGNVILFNWDLHYSPLNDALWDSEIGSGIFPILQQCFDRYSSLKKKPIFIWNEATAQHFGGTIGGFWDNIYAENEMVTQQYRHQIAGEERDPDLLTNDTKWNAFFNSTVRFLRGAECGPHHYFINKSYERHIRRQRIMETLDENLDLKFNLEIVYPDREIQRQREDTLYFIPFKDATDPLWALHDDGDCTHYCNTPYLWELLWDSMARIVHKNNII